ncbi:MAG: phosphatidylserine/phosphatidylglycerophosphate/cardiolipin synthase family protein [Desulfobacteraceae bacterium]|nr:phosphatidylserine/phosphatidylglycerophosphate/cardiolipin synthase family protein [Desulfobacteraceae bacterium]
MKNYFIFVLVLSCLTGCSAGPRTITYDLASLTQDHTIGIATNPFSSTGTLLSRIKTFTTEVLYRTHLRFFGYPLLNSTIPDISPDRDYLDKDKLNKWLDRKTKKPVKGDIKIFLSGNNFFPVVENDILNAEESINISTYIFDNDQYGIFFADLLKKKSKTVKVRVISDMLGCAIAWENSDKSDELSYMESQNMFTYLTKDSDIKLRKSRNIWLVSDHTKIIAIDGEKIYFGGMNIGNEYRYEWRDMMFEVKGDLIPEFQKIFDNAWLKYSFFGDFLLFFKKKFQRNIARENAGSTNFHILRTTAYRQEIYNAQIEAARRAKHHIYVENPYIWNETFLYELCAARNRGVDVRVTIPGDFDVKSFSGINKKIANILLKYGVRVFIYPGTSHIKAASYDGWVCFGTANYDDLSLHKNYEVNLATSDTLFSDKFEQEILLTGQNISSELKESFEIEITDFIKYNLKDYF